MASLGQIASGIAHEILNPINFVNNFSLLSKELLPEFETARTAEEQAELKSELTSNLDKIHYHGQRAYNIVKNMMLLSRNGSGEKTTVHVNKSLEDFLQIALHGFQSKVPGFTCEIENSMDQSLAPIEIVAEDFGSVILNVFNNAFYTMNEKRKKVKALGGSATVINYDPQLRIRTSSSKGMITIAIQDNGLGIPEEILGKIFLPFFTTKPTGEGTGLGLSIGHDIITKGNKGEFTVQSEVGKGSEFRISLPAKSVK
jgi:signal transduction histidine kinase